MRTVSVYLLLGLVAVLGVPPVMAESEKQPYEIKISATARDHLVHVGDDVVFEVRLLKDGRPHAGQPLQYRLSWDYFVGLQEGEAVSSAEPLRISGQADRPGFMLLQVSYQPAEGQKVEALGSVGVDPEKIRPSLPAPDDFNAFWDRKIQQSKAVPLEVKQTPVSIEETDFELFDVEINCPGQKSARGYYSRPIGAKPKSLPAVLYVHAAGVYSSWINTTLRGRGWNAITMDLNAHGTPNGMPEQYYKDLAEGELKDYCFRGFEDRETCYFVGMYLRIIRALEFLKSQPEWDGKTLVVYGGSQGGGQAIVAGGLDPQVTMVSAMIPGLCNQTGFLADQSTGWPRVAFHGEMPIKPVSDYNRQAVETARYIDPMNFAPRIRDAKVIVALGFIDVPCPPTTVYAMYNNLATPDKTVRNYPDRGHFYGTDKIESDSQAALAEYLRGLYGPLPMDKTESRMMTPNEMVRHFYDHKPAASWVTPETTVDRVIIGDGNKPISRVLVTWMPSLQAVQAAIDGGYDMILAHEPTFYDHRDYRDNPQDMEKDAMVMKKKRLIEENNLVIVRCHDFWDLHVGDGIPFAWARFLGFEGEPVQIGGGTYLHRYDIEATTVEELARRIARFTAKTGEPVIQVIGDGSLKVSKVGLGTGCATNPAVFQHMGCDVAVITDDGTSYWREIQRAADMGFPVIRVSHCASEDPGMETLAEYARKHFGVQADYYRNKVLYRLVGQ